MSFKQFMMEQDDSIDEVESVNKYNLYKQNISAQFISSYFEEHKAQQWFQEKYHPFISNQISSTKNVTLCQRFVSFWFLYENSLLDNISLDIEKFSRVEGLLNLSVLLMDYNIINDGSLNISDVHRKFLEKLKVLDSNDTIKPDTTTSTLNSEDGELNEHLVTEKQISLEDYMLPEGSDPIFTRFRLLQFF
ncbi:Serrate RNA effector molecule-like [Oopsacas minuta]|uniref:Serrate RNA effector molecule-like n=1 Tax=Oopsacas minuta TaxID=111878 RepID=A0AAV7JHW9_9METZ|nr:Serrate RNA effector molecule-like [Oopsacas minuta]